MSKHDTFEPCQVALKRGLRVAHRRGVRDKKGKLIETLVFEPGVAVDITTPDQWAALAKQLHDGGCLEVVTVDAKGRLRGAAGKRQAEIESYVDELESEISSLRAELETLSSGSGAEGAKLLTESRQRAEQLEAEMATLKKTADAEFSKLRERTAKLEEENQALRAQERPSANEPGKGGKAKAK